MDTYRIYYVTTAKPKTGKVEAAARWWAETGRKQFESKPGTKSVRAYITQMGLSSEAFPLEIWQEIENYAAFDQWGQKTRSDPAWFVTFFTELHQYYDLGPSRIMGEWSESYPR
jgi:hypothetical protein